MGITPAELAAISERLEAFAADMFGSLPREGVARRSSPDEVLGTYTLRVKANGEGGAPDTLRFGSCTPTATCAPTAGSSRVRGGLPWPGRGHETVVVGGVGLTAASASRERCSPNGVPTAARRRPLAPEPQVRRQGRSGWLGCHGCRRGHQAGTARW